MTTTTTNPANARALLYDFASARQCAPSYAGVLLANNGKLAARLDAGGSVSAETAEAMRQRARLYWPAGQKLPPSLG